MVGYHFEGCMTCGLSKAVKECNWYSKAFLSSWGTCRGRCRRGPAIAQAYNRMLNETLLLVCLKAEASQLSKWAYPTFWRRCSIIPRRWEFSWGKWMDSCAMAFSFHQGEAEGLSPQSTKRGWEPQDPRPIDLTPELAGILLRTRWPFQSLPCQVYQQENTWSPVVSKDYLNESCMGRKFLENLTCASYTLESEWLHLVLTWKGSQLKLPLIATWRQRANSTSRFGRKVGDYSMIGCLLHPPSWGSNLQPTHVP